MRYEQLAEGIGRIHQELAEVVETAESEDGLITASVDARGALVELHLDPRIYRATDSVALAESVRRTCKAAHDAAYQRAFELTAKTLDLVGPKSV